MTEAPRTLLQVDAQEGVTVVRFLESKLINDEDIQEAGDHIARLIDDGGTRNLLLDFSAVRYLSSAALGKLISLKRKIGAVNGRLKLCGIQPDPLEVFRITRLDTVFEIHKDARAALDRF